MLKVGDNPMGQDRVVTVEMRDSGDVAVIFPFWVDPLTHGPFTITYSPSTTLAFVSAQVDAVLHGDVPPFLAG